MVLNQPPISNDQIPNKRRGRAHFHRLDFRISSDAPFTRWAQRQCDGLIRNKDAANYYAFAIRHSPLFRTLRVRDVPGLPGGI